MQLILDTNGLIVQQRNKCFYIRSKTQQRLISPKRVDSILVTKDILLGSAAVKLAVKHRIPIIFQHPYGGVQARLWQSGYGTEAEIRRAQIAFAESPNAIDWMIRLFELKAQEQFKNLKYLADRKPNQKAKVDAAIQQMKGYLQEMKKRLKSPDSSKRTSNYRNTLMGLEGNIAKVYWQMVAQCLPVKYYFAKRSRRPAQDGFNAALNYLYGMLYAQVESAAIAAGLDTQFGILHADIYNKPTLCFDLIEPFRPWIDRLLIEQCMAKQLNNSHFKVKGDATLLDKKGKKLLIPLYHDKMDEFAKFDKRDISIKNHINVFCGKLANELKNKTI